MLYKKLIKRLVDFSLAFLLLLISLPLLLCLILLLWASHYSVFFIQARPGKNSKIFYLIKFKTMTDKRDAAGKLLPDKARITPIGKFIRSTSLDELPQLINVIKGDMSLIGPRPLLIKYLPLYTPEQARRHEVRPGITGWTQVNGRNSLSWEEKFKFDVWYVDNMSFALDMRILWRTLIKVLNREGINQQGQATMEACKGSSRAEGVRNQ
jgi:lipopolysaccharide/colanic/teichoic acid biosynthesis glycosyltransferase